MDASTITEPSRAIVVCDARALRAAAFHEFLRGWAEARALRVAAVEPDALPGLGERVSSVALGVLNLGSLSVGSAQAAAWYEAFAGAIQPAPIAVLSDRDEREEIVAAFRIGAKGFLPTRTEPSIAFQAFAFLMGGGSFFPPSALLDRVRPRIARSAQRETDLSSLPLTARQRSVLALLQEGTPNKTIARLLGMRESTVKVHVRLIMKKLGATNRTQAALTAAAGPLGGRLPVRSALVVTPPESADTDSGHGANGQAPE